MSDHDQKRRIEDSSFGKVIYTWPIIVSVTLTLFSIGGYAATVKYMADHIDRIDNWITSQNKASEERNAIMARLTTLAESMDHRVGRLEDWRDKKRG